ncbi:major facilitator superfamily transporter [Neoasaia chiangmaiensis NBRC 101099]|uniref:Uncharacterized protein n=1 Tax=Neoasaia chiangmaiensis TaxID=320497 RepID=A0A1U9KLL4_9PROT|nr:MFS transporter [Neoasaia chiangmaiensis]AQS86674.1 hypothetical protein A0U93_00480 [Neoasaia chiangmaiensis]GBR35773.1 major facilitator superfamily transporter [Neoasaia chiangmaiensis NBRC 101099]GEN16657.1 MFS transporter [Neoasaia chiangmaiensis]
MSIHEKTDTVTKSAYRAVDRNVLAVISLAYVVNCVDRANISFAHLRMDKTLHLTETDYGLAIGLFYTGYVLFQIPCAWLFERIGAARTFSRIMILWGLAGMAMALCTQKSHLFGLRFLLGAFEAGFSPLCIYFLRRWYQDRRLGRAISIQQIAGPLSGVLVGLISGDIMTRAEGLFGIAGWRWMFMIEAFPALLIGTWILFLLPNSPADASWLSSAQKSAFGNIALPPKPGTPVAGAARPQVRRWAVILFAFLGIVCGNDIFSFWLPRLIAEAHVGSLRMVGVLSSLPFAAAAVAMIVAGRLADRFSEHRVTLCLAACALGAACLLLLAIDTANIAVVLGCTTSGLASLYAAYVIFWTLPDRLLGAPGSATTYAAINTCGMIAGIICPIVAGRLLDATGSFVLPFCGTALLLICGGTGLLILGTSSSNDSGSTKVTDHDVQEI